MKRLLAIETSGEACSVALSLDGALSEYHAHEPLRHAELLLPAVRGLLQQAGVGLGALEAIVFGRGPGSFTSLRIGIGVVQGLALGADLPVIPLSSLAAVAQQARGGGAARILVALDARMGEVYCGEFEDRGADGLVPLAPERVCHPADIALDDAAATLGAGNGFTRFPELARLGASLRALQPGLLPRAAALLPLAQDWLVHHQPLPAREAQPEYLRNQVAVRPL